MSPIIDPSSFPFRDTRPNPAMHEQGQTATGGVSPWRRLRGIVPAIKALSQDLLREAAEDSAPENANGDTSDTTRTERSSRGKRRRHKESTSLSRGWRFGVWSGGLAVFAALVTGLFAIGTAPEKAWAQQQEELSLNPDWSGMDALLDAQSPTAAHVVDLFDHPRHASPLADSLRPVVHWIATPNSQAEATPVVDQPEDTMMASVSPDALTAPTPTEQPSNAENMASPSPETTWWTLCYGAWRVEAIREEANRGGVTVRLLYEDRLLDSFTGQAWRPLTQWELYADTSTARPTWQDAAGNATPIPACDPTMPEGVGLVLRDELSAEQGPYRYRLYRFDAEDVHLLWSRRVPVEAPRLLDLDDDGVCEWILPDATLQAWPSTAGRVGDPAIILAWTGDRYRCANAVYAAYVLWQRASASQRWPAPVAVPTLERLRYAVESLPADLPTSERMATLAALVYAGQTDLAQRLVMASPVPLSTERRRLRETWWSQFMQQLAQGPYWADLCEAFPVYADGGVE